MLGMSACYVYLRECLNRIQARTAQCPSPDFSPLPRCLVGVDVGVESCLAECVRVSVGIYLYLRLEIQVTLESDRNGICVGMSDVKKADVFPKASSLVDAKRSLEYKIATEARSVVKLLPSEGILE